MPFIFGVMRISCKDNHWIVFLKESIRALGYVVVDDILPVSDIEISRARLYSARDKIVQEIGEEKLQRANEYGVLRILMKYESYFATLLANPRILSIVDATLSETAILHLQNGFILPSFPENQAPSSYQNHLHRDFPRYLNGYVASVNILIAVDAFSSGNGGTIVVPASHQKPQAPDEIYIKANALPIECPAGSALVFDSTLWHASGLNSSGRDRLAINHQFTHSFFKPQIDYVRALGEEAIRILPARTQQLLGYYTRVLTSLDEFYRPEHERIYRKGQG